VVVFGYVTWILLRAFLKAKSLIKSLKVSDQWRAEVWQCAGRLLLIVCPPPNSSVEQQRMVAIVGYTLLDIRCLHRHNMMSYVRLQTNVLEKFVDAICIFFYTHPP